MATNPVSETSLTQQILAEFLASIESLDEFDAQTVDALRELTARGELKKDKRVTEVIVPKQKTEDEAPRTRD